jgi:hypothetical protein
MLGLSTSKLVLMRSRACFPSSRARSPRAEASPVMKARSSHTARYSSASLASSSRAWASCALMSAPLGGEGGGALGPFPGWGEPLRHRLPSRSRRLLGRWRARRSTPRGVVAPGAGVVGVAEPVVRGVEEPPEHHRVRHAEEVPSAYPCEVAGGSSLVEPWYDSSSVVAAGFPAARTRQPGRLSRATASMLAACATAAPRKPRGDRGPETAPPPVGAVAVSLAIASHYEVTHAARRRSVRAYREC